MWGEFHVKAVICSSSYDTRHIFSIRGGHFGREFVIIHVIWALHCQVYFVLDNALCKQLLATHMRNLDFAWIAHSDKERTAGHWNAVAFYMNLQKGIVGVFKDADHWKTKTESGLILFFVSSSD